jgi:hypothetical protein
MLNRTEKYLAMLATAIFLFQAIKYGYDTHRFCEYYEFCLSLWLKMTLYELRALLLVGSLAGFLNYLAHVRLLRRKDIRLTSLLLENAIAIAI